MIRPARREATYHDVLDAPEHMVAELIHGELYLQPRPAQPHTATASVLGMLLGPPFHLGRGGPGGWRIQDEPELHLGRHVLVPDLAGWRVELVPQVDLAKAFVESSPQWVCEVVSPSTHRIDRIKKLPIYAEHGVRHAWLIDPVARTLEVYRLEDGRWSMVGGYEDQAVVRAEPFDAVELTLADLWLPGTGG
jgi:Uma2 family endonuclease